MKKKLIFCFDLDNVICLTKKNYYHKSKPIHKSIEAVNKLYDQGYFIKIFTARFMGRSNENVKKEISRGYKLTEKQLKIWGVNYHKLIFGKPSFDVVIDDKSINFSNNWHCLLNKYYLIKNNKS